ncbi:MAG: hypothetical protein AB2L24_21745 [Mangrovibacterium sp.]
MKIEKTTAKKLYRESPKWFKKQLEKEFGAEFFTPNYFENLKTVEDCCRKLGVDPASLVNENDTPDEIAYKSLKIVIRAINTNEKGVIWEPDWNNTDQRKWWPWFNLSSGFGFSCSDCSYDNTHTSVGSRLCFESEEKSNYAATQFSELYKQFLTIKK